VLYPLRIQVFYPKKRILFSGDEILTINPTPSLKGSKFLEVLICDRTDFNQYGVLEIFNSVEPTEPFGCGLSWYFIGK